MPANELAEQYLHTFASNGAFPGGLAFHEALRQARLDFTPESLQRIDLLLRQIRKELRPSFAEFIDRNEHQNFLYLLCFYVGAVVYRYTREDVAWYPYQELKQVAPPEFMADYPEAFATSMVCMLKDSGTFLPLSSIQDVLFDDDSERSVMASADKFMGRLPDAGPIERPACAIALRDDKITSSAMASGWASSWSTARWKKRSNASARTMTPPPCRCSATRAWSGFPRSVRMPSRSRCATSACPRSC
jgi:hypothetical protein